MLASFAAVAARGLEYRVLGGLEVRREGAPVEVGGGRLRSLLGLLVVARGSAVSADGLADALWAGTPPRTARTIVQGYVSDLRKLLGPVVVTEAGGYRLALEDGAVDAARFERLLAEGRPEEALGLWRGPALAEFAYESWAQQEAGRLEELRLAAREELVEARLAEGRHSEVVAELEGLVEEHPFRERPLRQLMLALYRSGRQAEALAAYQRARERLVDELGIDPGPELQELHRKVLNQDPSLAAPPPAAAAPIDLPVPPTPLVGRERELEELLELLARDGVRLVTLTGPGGIGKTRLGLAAASRLRPLAADGVVFVPLAPISDPELVLPTIAAALSLPEQPGQPFLETLRTHLRERDLLLLLDNFEQVTEAAPALATLLTEAPRLRLLVTSRATLHLAAEHVYPVPPLALPDPEDACEPEQLGGYEAVSLFVERAQAAVPAFELTRENGAAVAEITVLLDGLPLAIELAAARTSILPPQALLARLDRRLAVLTGGARDLPRRQQTLRATLDWSFGLLGGEEQALFARLGVFVGGCSLDAAESVCGAALDTLAALVDESLLRRLPAPDVRFAQLAVVREYALERLAATGEDAALRRAHAAHFLELARQADAELRGGHQAEWLDRVEVEHDNLRAALAWAIESEPRLALSLAAALRRFWIIRGHVREAMRWLEVALAKDDGAASAERAAALNAAGALAGTFGDHRRALERFEEALAIFDTLGDDEGRARTLSNIGLCAWVLGDHDRGMTTLQECLAILTRIGDEWPIAVATLNLCSFELAAGRFEQARATCARSLEIARRIGDEEQRVRALLALAASEIGLGHLDAAAEAIEEGLRVAVEVVFPELVASFLDELAAVAVASGLDLDGATLAGAAEGLRETFGLPADPLLGTHERVLASFRDRRESGELARALEAGRALDAGRAAERALAVLQDLRPAAVPRA